ncbi:MAG: dTDP-glucose 4,6-dehydratase, partial [Acidobacteria bacterium]
AFVRVLLAQFPSCRVINLDSLTYAGNLDNLQGLDKSRHQLIRGDIAHRDDVFGALTEKTDAIINFAAESHVDRSILSADEFIRTNVLGTQVLLDAARERGVRRFIQISTDEVMGSLPENKKAFFSEESPFAPNSPYAASKAAAEHLVRAAHHTFGLDAVITRCGNNYGPYGDGLNVRDWIYVDDHCHAILLVLAKGRAGATYNIGARNERRNLDVARSVLAALGKPESLIRFVKDRPGHDRRYAIDPSLAEDELGWTPRETWESGLRKTIDWYSTNTEWVERTRSGAYREFYARQYGIEVGAR